MARHEIKYSMTEQPQFLRLVEFLHDVEIHAVAFNDDDLLELVHETRDELLDMRRES
jgi:hypothetical protein